jgi:hypothetical protein
MSGQGEREKTKGWENNINFDSQILPENNFLT